MAEQKKKKSLGWLWGILIGLVLAVSLVISICIMGLTIFLNIRKPKPGDTQIEVSIADPEKPDKPGKVDKPGKLDGTNDSFSLTDAGRTGLLEYAGYEERKFDYTPSVPDYSVNSDLSNVDNANRFYLDDEEKALLSANGFVVEDYNLSEFFEEYEYNRYSQVSSFVTVDSMMHTYHLYFAMLQKNTELDYLAADLSELSKCMVKESEKAYTALKGTEWESAAKKMLAFYTVGAYLSDNSLEINPAVSDMVNAEISKISAAQGIDTSVITGEYEDYSQYKPRGYYEGNATLESYFRAMMWYGRMNFAQKDEEMNRIALLSTLALSAGENKEKWEEIYSITSFFAGNSDDLGYYEYLPIIKEIYGDVVTYEKLVGDDESFDEFTLMISFLDAPQINSIAFDDNGGETDRLAEGKGFRFMGQRFSIDEAIFTQLVYSKIGENQYGDRRMLPDALDVPAALGSNVALSILDAQGDTQFEKYNENMTMMHNKIAQEEDTLWTGSLYAGWVNTLRPLLDVKGEGYPMFMQNLNWEKKDLECFAGSWTELKHDTVLYSKQIMAEMGGGDEEIFDDRGYVQPEPEVFERLAALSYQTKEGLAAFGVISDNDAENLTRLGDLAAKLSDISVKELENKSLSEEDYELIRTFGGTLEHFWKETVKDQAQTEYVDSEEFPAALVVDVATDPNGQVLEEAIGGATVIYVVFPVEGKLMIGRGTVYSYYQFTWPMSDRMTDSEWRRKLGRELNDYGEYERDMSGVDKPWWTCDYRKFHEYNW